MEIALVMFKADGSRREYTLTKTKTVIGRTLNCDLRIPLKQISRRHCEIRITEKDVILRDLGSSNGTFHNSLSIKNAKLQPGDEIVIGPVIFTVVMDGEPTHIYPRRTIIAAQDKQGDAESVPSPNAPSANLPDPLNAAATADDDPFLDRLDHSRPDALADSDQLDHRRPGPVDSEVPDNIHSDLD